LLDALPLSPGIYLAGKVLSLWLSLAIGLSLAGLISGLVWWGLVGPFNWAIFAEMWFGAALIIAAINAASSALLAAGQPNNQRALMVGFGLAALGLIGLGFILIDTETVWRFFNPARPAAVLYYFLGWPGAMATPDEMTRTAVVWIQTIAGRDEVIASLLAGLGQVALLWLMVWQWLKRRAA